MDLSICATNEVTESARTGASRSTFQTERPGTFVGGSAFGIGRDELRAELQVFAAGVLRHEFADLSTALQQCLRRELAEALSEASFDSSASQGPKKPPCPFFEMSPRPPSPPAWPPPELDETIGVADVSADTLVGRWLEKPSSVPEAGGVDSCTPQLPREVLRQELAEMSARMQESLRQDISELLEEARSHTSQFELVRAFMAREPSRPEPYLPLPTPDEDAPALPEFPDSMRGVPGVRSDARRDTRSPKSWSGLGLPSELYAQCDRVAVVPVQQERSQQHKQGSQNGSFKGAVMAMCSQPESKSDET